MVDSRDGQSAADVKVPIDVGRGFADYQVLKQPNYLLEADRWASRDQRDTSDVWLLTFVCGWVQVMV